MGFFDDDEKPKRLSLRERMAMRESSGGDCSTTSVTNIQTTSDSALKKYRQSREVKEDEALETSTKRRVVRLDENGNEEVIVRDRNLINTNKEEIKREVERKTKNNESLAEEEELEGSDSNNNKKITSEITKQPPVKTDEQRKREREERRASRRREIEIKANNESKTQEIVAIETSVTTDGVTNTKTNRFLRKSEDGTNKENKKGETKAEDDKNEEEKTFKKRSSVHDRFKKDEKEAVSSLSNEKVVPNQNETKTPVTEENIKSVAVKKEESAKVVEEKKNDVAPLSNKGKFELKTTGVNKRPQSMGDFKSRFENKNSTSIDNKLNKRPVSMNIKTKFEQQSTQPAKIELKKTYSTPARTTTSTTKTEKDEGGVHTEVTTTVKESSKGEGAAKCDVKEIKSVETKDTARQHAEKTTTVTETKTAGGTMTVKKTETKIETKPALKKTGSSATKSVEERMKERKQKEALAKKQQSAGRNAFKLKLEANAGPVNFKLQGQKSPGGVMAGLSSPKTPTSGDSNIDKLLKWIAKRINQYPAVNVTNFTTSWADGIALCALMNYLLGDEAINPLAVSSDDNKKNFEMAIDCATKHGVPALIDAAEMTAASEIDRRSMITYLHTIYKVLWHDKQEKK